VCWRWQFALMLFNYYELLLFYFFVFVFIMNYYEYCMFWKVTGGDMIGVYESACYIHLSSNSWTNYNQTGNDLGASMVHMKISMYRYIRLFNK
jgi:hypothetical protein